MVKIHHQKKKLNYIINIYFQISFFLDKGLRKFKTKKIGWLLGGEVNPTIKTKNFTKLKEEKNVIYIYIYIYLLQFFLQSYIINKFYYCMIHLAKKKWY
jgi:hypothetical protein